MRVADAQQVGDVSASAFENRRWNGRGTGGEDDGVKRKMKTRMRMHNTRQHEDNSSSPPLTLPPLSLFLSLSPSGSVSLHLSISLSPPLSLSASLGAAPPPMAASSASGAGGASSASQLRGFPADGTPANSPQHSRGAREEGSERGGATKRVGEEARGRRDWTGA